MLTLQICWLGKKSADSPEEQMVQRYATRLKPWCKLTIHVLKPLNSAACDADQIRRKEHELFATWWDGKGLLVVLDERGKAMSSHQWADWLEGRSSEGHSKITYLVGGAHGVDPALQQKAQLLLSLGPLTLPHGLARVLLIEQIYRAMAIRKGHPYHHDD
jgi:23S rRNA (pseudouridine1915-N3)-methyltransferase